MGQQRMNDRRSVGERREQLVDAAIEVLATAGLAGTTTRAVTDQAGLALGAFHYAFTSKDELLAAVLSRRAGYLEQALREALTDVTDVDEIIANLGTVALRLVRDERPLLLALYELTVHALRHPHLRPVAAEQYDRSVAVVRSALLEVDPDRTNRDADELARFVVATLDGLIIQDLVHADADAAVRRVALYTEVVTPLANGAEAD